MSKLKMLITDFHSIFFISVGSSECAVLALICPIIGITIAERFRDKGYDIVICFDDLSKHARAYRQIALLMSKIPSRDAFPSDIFNIHAGILERGGKLK